MVTNLPTSGVALPSRTISWIKAARKDFDAFPGAARDLLADALAVVAGGGAPKMAKAMTKLGAGVMELALAHDKEAYRVVYALKIGDDIWVVHAFQKKATKGIRTPTHEIDVVRERLKRLKEMLK